MKPQTPQELTERIAVLEELLEQNSLALATLVTLLTRQRAISLQEFLALRTELLPGAQDFLQRERARFSAEKYLEQFAKSDGPKH